jgi:hypothetical protein
MDALKIKYNTKIFIKDTIRIYNWCKKEYNPKRSKQKFCSSKCNLANLHSDKELQKENGRKSC